MPQGNYAPTPAMKEAAEKILKTFPFGDQVVKTADGKIDGHATRRAFSYALTRHMTAAGQIKRGPGAAQKKTYDLVNLEKAAYRAFTSLAQDVGGKVSCGLGELIEATTMLLQPDFSDMAKVRKLVRDALGESVRLEIVHAKGKIAPSRVVLNGPAVTPDAFVLWKAMK